MNTRTAAVSVLAAAALALTACADTAGTAEEPMDPVSAVATPEGSEPITPSAEPIEPSSAATTDPGVNRSPRGNLMAELGDTGTVSTAEGAVVGSFVVKDISPGVCTEAYQSPAENGTILFVTMDITTAPAGNVAAYQTISASSYNWGFVSNAGTTFNGDLANVATYSCIPEASTVPSDIGPGESVTGIVVLDVPEPSGILTYAPSYGAAFEYEF